MVFASEDVLTIRSHLAKYPAAQYEAELRFGSWGPNFRPGVTKLIWEKILNYKSDLWDASSTSEKTLVWISKSGSGKRIIYHLDSTFKKTHTEFQIKTRLIDYDLRNDGLRFSISQEVNLDSATAQPGTSDWLIRYRERNTLISSRSKLWQIDLTKTFNVVVDFQSPTIATDIKNQLKDPKWEAYEVELERLPGSQTDEIYFNEMADIIAELTALVGSGNYSPSTIKIYKTISQLSHPNGLGLGSRDPKNIDFVRDLIVKPIALTRQNFVNLETMDYTITEKADGLHRLLFHSPEMGSYFITSQNETILFGNLGWAATVLIDGEYLEKENMFLCFDLLIANEDMTIKPLRQRLEALMGYVPTFEKKKGGKKKVSTTQGDEPIKIYTKNFLFKQNPTDSIKPLIAEFHKIKFAYETDGFIFTPNTIYKSQVLKWKPADKLTVDFLLKLDTAAKSPRYTLFTGMSERSRRKTGRQFPANYKLLFKDMDSSEYYPFPFYLPDSKDPEYLPAIRDTELDNTICELTYSDGAWKFYRIHEDKTASYRAGDNVYGNDYEIAMKTFATIVSPLTMDMLVGKEPIPYYAEGDDFRDTKVMQGVRKYHNQIKGYLYQRYASNISLLIEEAAGRFGDLLKWRDSNIKKVIALEIDQEAINIGLSRWRDQGEVPPVEAFQADLRHDITRHVEINRAIGSSKAQAVFCMFAVHYFLSSETEFDNFMKNSSHWMAKGGYLVLTTMDGERVVELMRQKEIAREGILRVGSEEEPILMLRRNYGDFEGNLPPAYGARIDVFIKSIGTFVPEFLVNIPHLIKTIEGRGFKLVENMAFDENIKTKKIKFDSLSADEKIFSRLNRILVFSRESTKD